MPKSNRERAIEMRKAGLSRSQICRELGLKSGGGALTRWLREVAPPPPASPKRAALQDEAVRLRLEGRTYAEIGEALGVAKSTLSLWLRDVPLTDEHRERVEARRLSRSVANRARSDRRIETLKAAAASEIGPLTERELFIAGVVAYWAEGGKHKPWNRSSQVQFVNEDPGMVRLFLAWLDQEGFGADTWTFRVAIHETANVERARHFWAQAVRCAPEAIRVSLKRHNPSPKRHHKGDDYVGVLIVRVRRSTTLVRMLDGWARGIDRAVSRPYPDQAQSGVV